MTYKSNKLAELLGGKSYHHQVIKTAIRRVRREHWFNPESTPTGGLMWRHESGAEIRVGKYLSDSGFSYENFEINYKAYLLLVFSMSKHEAFRELQMKLLETLAGGEFDNLYFTE
jgi:hypothetical protein